MDHTLFSAEDLAADESFIAYFFKNDDEAITYWTNWISKYPEKLEDVLTAEHLLSLVYFGLTTQEQQIAFDKFDNFLLENPALKDVDQPGNLRKDRGRNSIFNLRIATLAASVFIMITLGGLYLADSVKKKIHLENVTIYNDYGKVKILLLNDGTKVTLNANSSLTYPKHFEDDGRYVSLKGEAFFEVVKDKKRPFTVAANGTRTRVLGTSFNIDAYQTQKTVVALLEGSVAFELDTSNVLSADQSTLNSRKPANVGRIILRPSELVSYSTQDQQMKISAFKGHDLTAWTSGTIIFSEASFADIAAKFQNMYGINLIDRTSMHQWSYSGKFTKTNYLTIIKSICFAKNLSYKQNNHNITLTNN